jgi:hypothetical protein
MGLRAPFHDRAWIDYVRSGSESLIAARSGMLIPTPQTPGHRQCCQA